jgi:hypothetical protein
MPMHISRDGPKLTENWTQEAEICAICICNRIAHFYYLLQFLPEKNHFTILFHSSFSVIELLLLNISNSRFNI